MFRTNRLKRVINPLSRDENKLFGRVPFQEHSPPFARHKRSGKQKSNYGLYIADKNKAAQQFAASRVADTTNGSGTPTTSQKTKKVKKKGVPAEWNRKRGKGSKRRGW